MKNISYIIPVHGNYTKYLKRCLSSIYWQLRVGDEIIIVLNNVNIEVELNLAGHIPEGFLNSESIRLLTSEDGVSNARNEGIRQSENEIIKFIDVDDMLAPFAAKTIKENFTNGILIGGQLKYIDGVFQGYSTYPRFMGESIRYINPFLVNNCVIEKQLLIDIGMFDPKIEFEEDYDLWLRIYSRYGMTEFHYIDSQLGIYNIDTELRAKTKRSHLRDGIDVREYFRKQYNIPTII